MYLGEQMWEWHFREFMTDFHIPLEQYLHAQFFYGRMLELPSTGPQLELKQFSESNWNDNKSTCILTEKGYKNYLEKLENLSLTTKESGVKDISEEISLSPEM